MMAKPQAEHEWLDRLLGDWIVTSEMPGEGGVPPIKMEWSESVRSMNGLWVVAEGAGTMPGTDEPTPTLMTLGYDPNKQLYVGTWVGSMMTNMWVYEGSLDESGQVLTLECEGPDFADPARRTCYLDIITIEDADNRVLTSRVRGADGRWQQVMSAHYRRRT